MSDVIAPPVETVGGKGTTRCKEVRAQRWLLTCDQESISGAGPDIPVSSLRFAIMMQSFSWRLAARCPGGFACQHRGIPFASHLREVCRSREPLDCMKVADLSGADTLCFVGELLRQHRRIVGSKQLGSPWDQELGVCGNSGAGQLRRHGSSQTAGRTFRSITSLDSLGSTEPKDS